MREKRRRVRFTGRELGPAVDIAKVVRSTVFVAEVERAVTAAIQKLLPGELAKAIKGNAE